MSKAISNLLEGGMEMLTHFVTAKKVNMCSQRLAIPIAN